MRKLLVPVLIAMLAILQGCAPVAVGTVVGAGAVMAADRRTTGIYVEDQNIELKCMSRISERFSDQVHINATSFNRVVLLTGEAPTELLKEEIGKIAAAVENVREVVNDIQIAGPTSYGSRSNDSYLTSKVKANLLEAKVVQANYVKVVTENGVVYLMGLVTRKEADEAAEIASTTDGVRKVVKVLEYLD